MKRLKYSIFVNILYLQEKETKEGKNLRKRGFFGGYSQQS